MTFTIVGILTLLLGAFSVIGTPAFSIRTAIFLSLLGSAAAISLPALGGASVLAGAFFTGFIVIRALALPQGGSRVLANIQTGSPGLWLALAVGYAVTSAFFIAPFFYGEVDVAPIARSSTEEVIFLAGPLQPSSGNVTQSVYAIGHVFLFAAMAATIRTQRSRRIALDALVALGCAHILFSLLDLLTFFTGTSFLIDWLRSANYLTWQNSTVGGLKRVSGLFPEASMYAIYGITVSGIMLSLRVSNYRPFLTGTLFYASLFFLIISTSTTAYASLAACGAVLAVYSVIRMLRSDIGIMSALTKIGFVVVLCIILTVFVAPYILDMMLKMLDEVVFSKAESVSVTDRGQLNALAFKAFFETYGLGVGLGGARTSSFAITLLSNFGAIGTAFWLVFFLRCVAWPAPMQQPGCVAPQPEDFILRRAAQSGMIGCVIAASTSLHVFEMGTLFYILAAFTLPVSERVTATQPHFHFKGALPQN